LIGICGFVTCNCALAPRHLQAQSAKPAPLILEKEQGERRLWRPIQGLESGASLFILKVDLKNGGSQHLVFGTEDLLPGDPIEVHRHPGSDEILFFQTRHAHAVICKEP